MNDSIPLESEDFDSGEKEEVIEIEDDGGMESDKGETLGIF